MKGRVAKERGQGVVIITEHGIRRIRRDVEMEDG